MGDIKTFSSVEKSILGVTNVRKHENIESNGIIINVKNRRVYFKDKEIILATQEYLLLLYFIKNKNEVLTRDEILEGAWVNGFVGDRTIDAHRCHLNRKLGATFIETKRGFGYQWVEK